jgi:thiol reductant ABC exporter CydD subunit
MVDRRLVRRARPVRVLLGLDVALGLATALLVLVQAVLIAHVVVRAFDGASLAAVAPELGVLLLVFAGRALFGWGFEVAGARAAADVLSELRLEVAVRRLRAHPLALDGVEAGEVAASSVQGLEVLAGYFGRYLPQAVLACVVPPAVLVWAGVVDPLSALVMLLTLPLVPVFMWLIGRYSQERARKRWETLRLLSNHFLDVVRGLPTLRAYNRGRAQAEAIADVGDRYRRATMGTLRLAFLSGSVLELASTLGVALVAVTVGVRLDEGGIGFQAALTVLLLAPELYAPLRQLGTQFHASADGRAVAERLLALADSVPEAPRGGGALPPSPAAAEVRLEGLVFSYPARPGRVLDGFDLTLYPGETVALAGPSGGGKSTVASLLLRLAEPEGGRITVGGVDLACCDAEAWRRHAAWVPQHPTIFRGTVGENIALGDPGASAERIREAAVLAGADGFVDNLPHGYATDVGDGGRPLSAGERRRLALARAFLRDAPLVVLDEPTADLDPESALLVREAVERLCLDRTVLLIAHRPELVEAADRIVLLDRGRAAAPQAVPA